MTRASLRPRRGVRAVVVGAGIGGLAAALCLSHEGLDVDVLERHEAPGGKMRTLPSVCGPVDAGPTVLTLRPAFEALFAAVGERLEDHVELIRLPLIARHFWPDGSRIDLYDDEAENIRSIREFAGSRAASQFEAFSGRARRLFRAFDAPVMQAPQPSTAGILRTLLGRPGLLRDMAPHATLSRMLDRSFEDRRLAQLFGRYATYVGGSPYHAPALLSLIWQAEAAGVWSVQGGLHGLARAVAGLTEARGARFHYGADVARIDSGPAGVTGVTLSDGTRIPADVVVFNGDPRALAQGALGSRFASLAPMTATLPRSLSADVWAFAARCTGPDLAHHNVFFRDDAEPEFRALARGERCPSPTLYVCAMDRGQSRPPSTPQRFEIIANAPPLTRQPDIEETPECRNRIFGTLETFGLRYDPAPPDSALTTPRDFEAMFPHSAGSLYGQSPHGLMAAFRRPTARTAIPGLYLAGGGTHPGAGVPMATLSGRHAAEAIVSDRISTSRSRRTVMLGGTSTGSATTAAAPSASSHS